MPQLTPVEHCAQKFRSGVVPDVIIRESPVALPLQLPPLKLLVVSQHTGATDALDTRQLGKPVPDLSQVLALFPGLAPAEIVNGVSGRPDEVDYLDDARFASVAAFGGDSGLEPNRTRQKRMACRMRS